MRVNSTERPNKFWQNNLGEKVELIIHENIEEVTKEGEISFDSDMLFGVAKNNRDDIIAGFVHLKYSVDKEIALTHKGIANAQDPEYVAYRDFVAEVKSFVG